MFENCLLVKMTRKRPAQEVLDHEASLNYNQEKETDAKLYKNLFKNNKHVAALNNTYTQAYMYHINHSNPWLDKGFRIIGGDHIAAYMENAALYRNALQTVLLEFKDTYDQAVEEDLKSLKSLGKRNDYPSYDDFAKSWVLDVQFRPVPQAGDFRIKVAQEITDGLEQSLQDLGVATVQLLKNNLKSTAKEIFDSLNKVDKERRLFSSTFDNFKDLCQRTLKLNVTNDPMIDFVCTKLVTTVIDNYPVDELRRFAAARLAFIDDVQTLLEKL